MKEKIIMFVFCFVIFGISISTLFNQTVSLFKKDEKVSDVVKGHELETKKDKSGVKGAVDSFTSNLTGKKEGAKAASEVTKKTSGNTYIESTQVLLGKEDWLFYKSTEDGDPISDYQGINHYDENTMQTIADKLTNERNQFSNYGIDFYILSIPNKASVYPEYMPDTIERKDTTSKTDLLMKYLEENTDLNVVDVKPTLVKAKKKQQVYYKSDTHFNQIGAFVTVQALKDKIDGNADSLKNVKFDKVMNNYSGDLARLCDMQDTFNNDTQYQLDPATVNTKIKSDKKILVIGDSYSDEMLSILSQYFAEAQTVNIWSFEPSLLDEYKPDIVVWEHAERYTDRFNWISLFG
ncbi:hypothetical protein DXD61_10300 [Eubacterium sp. TM06-47]|nr:hypothetical protein DXD61_10300 [Eubacterium sp. TM06-47]